MANWIKLVIPNLAEFPNQCSLTLGLFKHVEQEFSSIQSIAKPFLENVFFLHFIIPLSFGGADCMFSFNIRFCFTILSNGHGLHNHKTLLNFYLALHLYT